MSVNLPTHYVQQFSTNIQLLLQQKGSKLRDAVLSGSHVGKQASPVDQIGSVVAQRVSSRFAPMSRVDAATDRRWVFPVDYDLPQLIDSLDKLRMINDPQSAYVQNAVMALGRAMDDEIITAFFGTAKTGEAGATSTTFLSANQVAAGGAGLTVTKLIAAKRILMANEVDLDSDPIYCVVSAAQHADLLADTKVISLDYNTQPVLVNGKIQQFLGIQFIHSERLPVNGSSQRRVPVFAKSGMYLGLWNDIMTDVSQRKDLQNMPWQVYAAGTFGATRLEEKKIAEVPCVES